MLTRNDREEALCKAYVRAVAAQAGAICSEPDYDYGIDLCLRAVRVRGRRHTDIGGQVDLQLKSTTRALVRETEVLYDLDVKNYDDLRQEGNNCPRLLVVLVLPEDEAQWLGQSEQELALRGCAYWISLSGRGPVAATTSVRIAIPRASIFSAEAVQSLLASVVEGGAS